VRPAWRLRHTLKLPFEMFSRINTTSCGYLSPYNCYIASYGVLSSHAISIMRDCCSALNMWFSQIHFIRDIKIHRSTQLKAINLYNKRSGSILIKNFGFVFMRAVLMFLALTFSQLLLAAPNKTLRCATTHYPPFTIYDEQTNTFSGLDIEYLRFIERNLNLNIDVVHLPWARIKKEMTLGYYDCYFSLANNKERSQYLDFTSEPLHITQFGLFGKTKEQLNTTDLSAARIAMLRGDALPNIIAAH